MTTESELPDPLVPEHVDLTGYAFTPLFRARLFGSVFHATATDAEWRAGVTLWLKSWDQIPAGTLPPHNALLARLAEMTIDAWEGVREVAMHGWVLCQDGRLHHAVVAEGVLEAWASKKKLADNGAKGAAKRWGLKIKNKNGRANGLAIAPPMAPPWPGYSNGEGEGYGERKTLLRNAANAAQGLKSPSNGGEKITTEPPPADPKTWLFQTGLQWLVEASARTEKAVRPLMGKWLQQLAGDPGRLKLVIERAIEENTADPIGWISAAVKTRAANQSPQPDPQPPPGDPYHLDDDDIFLARIFGGDATDTLLFKRGLFQEGWPFDRLGPPPHDPKCKIDPVVLSRHGYRDGAIYAEWRRKNGA